MYLFLNMLVWNIFMCVYNNASQYILSNYINLVENMREIVNYVDYYILLIYIVYFFTCGWFFIYRKCIRKVIQIFRCSNVNFKAYSNTFSIFWTSEFIDCSSEIPLCLQKFCFLVMFSNSQVWCVVNVMFLQVHGERLNPLC